MRSIVSVLIAAATLAPLPALAQSTPAPAAASADPARLRAATQVVARIFPPGIYKKLMGSTFDQLLETMTGSIGAMPVRDVARLTGITQEEAAKLGETTTREVMEIYDPQWQARFRLGTRAMTDAMTGMMTETEPAIREAMARAYAREFSAAELGDIERFFISPSGARYADRSMALMMDPEIMKATTSLMPKLMQRMPDVVAKAEAATRNLPKPRTNKDLTPAERKKLAGLLGVDEKRLLEAPDAGLGSGADKTGGAAGDDDAT